MLNTAESMSYTILYTGHDGHSYFKTAEEPLNEVNIGLTSKSIPIKNMVFSQSRKGSPIQDWHNAPHRLYVIVLSGVMQIETSKGDIQNFKAGEVLSMEDLTGKGHRTSSLNGEAVDYIAIVP